MALMKDSFFQEPLTQEQERIVKVVEEKIDVALKQHYDGCGIELRVHELEATSDYRCRIEVVRRYEKAGWSLSWREDSMTGELRASVW